MSSKDDGFLINVVDGTQGKASMLLRIPHVAVLSASSHYSLVTFEQQQKVKQLQRTIAESKLAIHSLTRVVSELESRLENLEPSKFTRKPISHVHLSVLQSG